MEKERCQNLFLTEVEEVLVYPERHMSVLVHERGGEYYEFPPKMNPQNFALIRDVASLLGRLWVSG